MQMLAMKAGSLSRYQAKVPKLYTSQHTNTHHTQRDGGVWDGVGGFSGGACM